MPRLSRGLADLATRTRLVGRGSRRVARERDHWRQPLQETLLRSLEQAVLSSARAAAGGPGGDHRSRAQAASTDFVDYRGYMPGDDFRRIDWNAYSRLDQLFVKLTEARERLSFRLLLDCSASMNAGGPNKFDRARQLAAAIGYVALARYDRVELVRLGGQGAMTRPLRGKHRFGELVAALDLAVPAGSLDLDRELTQLRTNDTAGQAVLISDMLHPAGYERGLEALARRGLEPAVIHVLSPQELEPLAGDDVELEDLETDERLQVGLSGQAVGIYRSRLAEWCERIERFCGARGMRYLRLTTEQPLEHAVLVGLRQARILD